MGPWLPLERTMICLDGEHVFDVVEIVCPACGAAHVMPLARWLGTVGVELAGEEA